MPDQKIPPETRIFGLLVSGMPLTEDRKKTLEEAANTLAATVDAIGPLDPLDSEPAMIFDPAP